MAHSIIRQPIPVRASSPSSLLIELPNIMASCSSPRVQQARLLSPFQLSRRRPSLSRSISPSPCGNTKRRRGFYESPQRAQARQRRCLHQESCFISRQGPAFFDDLPWISIMEAPPVLHGESHGVVDLADLSQLSGEQRRSTTKKTSGAGPIRHRRTSLRSAPFPTETNSTASSSSNSATPHHTHIDITAANDNTLSLPELSPSLSIDSTESDSDFDDLHCPSTPPPPPPTSFHRLPFGDANELPKTPPRRTSVLPSAVRFHNLMPVIFPTSAEDTDGLWWLKTSSRQHQFD